MRLYLDTETYSECDLIERGAYVYATHPSTQVLMVQWALGPAEPQYCSPAFGDELPADLLEALQDPAVEIVAHNAQFDRWMLWHVLGLREMTPISRWRCTMAKALSLGLPSSLGDLGAVLGLSEGAAKIKDGKRLIRLFSMPQVPRYRRREGETEQGLALRIKQDTYRATPDTHPEDWARFVEYGLRDVVSLREIDRRVPEYNYRGQELELWRLDQVINDRGLPVDMPLAHAVARLCDEEQARLNEELRDITGRQVQTHSQRDAALTWLRQQDVALPGYTKADVTQALANDNLPPDARRVLEIRREAGRSSTAKYLKIAQVSCPKDHRIRGALQYAGASRTMRWAGRMVQPQNFPRPSLKDTDTAAEAVLAGSARWMYDDIMSLGADCLRPTIAAPEGFRLVAGDYSNIEGRMLAWLAGESWKLDAFRAFDQGKGHDLYKLTYSRAFDEPIEQVDDDKRFIGKVAELACGYGGSVGAFAQMAANFGTELPEARVRQVVAAWRRANAAIASWWYELEDAAKAAVRDPGKIYSARSVEFRSKSNFLLCKLPSGRFLPYYQAHIDATGQLVYYGQDQQTRRWVSISTYGGKLSENVTQAAARDVMAYNMPLVEAAGYPIVGTVHDEIITEPRQGFGSATGLEAAMAQVPPWCPGLPLAVGAWEGQRYRK